MRSSLRSAILAGSVLSLSFVLVGCDDASKTTTTPAPDVKAGTTEPSKNAMEPGKDGAMEPGKGGAMDSSKPAMDPAAPAPADTKPGDAPK